MSRRSMRRLREKENRCNTILKAAETLFGRKGYHQTSIEEIADLAEVSTGSVYFYFKNKEELLIKLMQEIGHDLRKSMGEEFQKTEFSLDSFRTISFAFLGDFCLRYPEKIAIFFRESVGQSVEVEEQRKQVFVKLTLDIKDAVIKISEGKGRHFVTDLSPELIAVCIVGIYDRIACYYLLWQDRSQDVMQMAGESASFMLGGVNNLFIPDKLKPGRKKKDAPE
ncbi:MAG TPA: TetR/AcrR family transcriptional regulator [Syntrophales bacterium]|nr:TetR/AcrR family transcriptional regulator [Syntrophales bacterium]